MTALDGVVVLDLTRLLPGAVATLWLANFGAEVIKIEEPGTGDYARTLAPAVFDETNRGKKSIALDLKGASGRDRFLQLAAIADVLVESFRPGVMDRLGLGWPALHETNPKLVYCAISGFGQEGPLRELAGHDLNYMAIAGLLEPPTMPVSQLADLVGGSMQAVVGILLALQARTSTGNGQLVDVSMTDGVEVLLPVTGSNMLTGGLACYNLYPTGDGRCMAVGALEPKFWVNLCQAIGATDLIPVQFVPEAQPQIRDRLAAEFTKRTQAEWWDLFRSIDACVTPVLTAEEARAKKRNEPIPRLSATPGRVGGPAPRLGEHNPG